MKALRDAAFALTKLASTPTFDRVRIQQHARVVHADNKRIRCVGEQVNITARQQP